MSSDDDLLVFSDEDDSCANQAPNEPWHVLVIDDESEVHAVTRLALKNFLFANSPIEIHSAYSAKEAKEKIVERDDYALALVDVVMETDHAGLDLVQWIREELGNHEIRLVLRTGQPGQAPERKVIATYDINDYKEKTELTSNKLYTLIHSSLRSYRDIIALKRNKEGLEKVINSTREIFIHQSMGEFTQGILAQMCALLGANTGAYFSEISGIAAFRGHDDNNRIIAAVGKFLPLVGDRVEKAIDESVITEQQVNEVLEKGGQLFGNNYFLGVYQSHLPRKNILYLEGLENVSDLDRHLAELFGTNVGIAFDNQAMQAEVETTQEEIIYKLGEAVESCSKEAGNHVKRMALTCRVIAERLNMDDHEIDVIFKAAPLHDIGKITTPHSILNKPGKLTDEEWEIMKSHARKGREMLASSKMEILRAGATIAGTHHENWDGSGYPEGLSGDKIPLMGQIAAIADVWDALISRRCYKNAWNVDEVLAHFEDMRDKKFSSQLVDIVYELKDELMAIQKNFSDNDSP